MGRWDDADDGAAESPEPRSREETMIGREPSWWPRSAAQPRDSGRVSEERTKRQRQRTKRRWLLAGALPEEDARARTRAVQGRLGCARSGRAPPPLSHDAAAASASGPARADEFSPDDAGRARPARRVPRRPPPPPQRRRRERASWASASRSGPIRRSRHVACSFHDPLLDANLA